MTVRTISASRSPGCSIAAVIAASGWASANCWSVAYKSAMRRASRSSRVSVDIEESLDNARDLDRRVIEPTYWKYR